MLQCQPRRLQVRSAQGEHSQAPDRPATRRPAALGRRQLGLGGLAAAAAAALQLGPGSSAAVGRDLTPYERGFQMEYGLLEGRVRACPSDVNPNCVSSASLNECYSPAWEAGIADVKRAIQDFEGALLAVSPGAQVVASESSPSSEYRRYRVASAFDHDDVEVLISGREDGEAPLVTYRSMAGAVRYVWPIILPISDFGAQRARMKAIRGLLGWRIPGCDLYECFLE